MSKYIIEFEEKPLCVFDKDTQTYFPRLWRVKGFNGLVFDKEGLSRLEELNSDYINEHFGDLQNTAYQRGLEEGNNIGYKNGVKDGQNKAWEAAKKIAEMWTRIDNEEFLAVFGITERIGHSTIRSLFEKQTANEAIEKLKAYEQKRSDKIKRGDIVNIEGCCKDNLLGVVTKVWEDNCYIMWGDGSGGAWSKDSVVKTGKHIDIDKILEELRYDS